MTRQEYASEHGLPVDDEMGCDWTDWVFLMGIANGQTDLSIRFSNFVFEEME